MAEKVLGAEELQRGWGRGGALWATPCPGEREGIKGDVWPPFFPIAPASTLASQPPASLPLIRPHLSSHRADGDGPT